MRRQRPTVEEVENYTCQVNDEWWMETINKIMEKKKQAGLSHLWSSSGAAVAPSSTTTDNNNNLNIKKPPTAPATSTKSAPHLPVPVQQH